MFAGKRRDRVNKCCVIARMLAWGIFLERVYVQVYRHCSYNSKLCNHCDSHDKQTVCHVLLHCRHDELGTEHNTCHCVMQKYATSGHAGKYET